MVSINAKTGRKLNRDPNVYPKGWDYEKTMKLAEYYDRRKDQAVLKQSRRSKARDFVWMEIPRELLEDVQKLIATKRKSA